MDRLIPFPIFDWPGPSKAPADFFARSAALLRVLRTVLLAAGLALVGGIGTCRADAETEHSTREPIYRPTRPANTKEFLERCKEDSLYCDEQFALYVQRYAAVRIEELARQEEYRKMRENLRDPTAFDGICLPRDRLFSDGLPPEIARNFRRWADKHPETYGARVPVGIKAAMQALYPCS